jgi:hypothetical protein
VTSGWRLATRPFYWPNIQFFLNQAVDKVRRAEHRELQQSGDDRLKGMRQTMLFNRSDDAGEQRHPQRFACVGLHQRGARRTTGWPHGLPQPASRCMGDNSPRTPNTSEPTARMNAAIVPTANKSPAKKEETPGVKRAECQMVLVYAHGHVAGV